MLTTGNKSELAVGYSTIYGDSVGGFNPVKDVPKTLVWELARWRNAEAERRGETPPIPENSITKPPSRSCDRGRSTRTRCRRTSCSTRCSSSYVEQAHGRSELLADGFEPAVVDSVVTMVDRAEWKRRQSAPGPKTSPVAFGRDRRLPITSRWREHRSHRDRRPAPAPRARRRARPARRRSCRDRTGTGEEPNPLRRRSGQRRRRRPRGRSATAPHPGAPPAADEGARRALRHAHRLRPVRRGRLRRGRHPGPAGRRQRGQQRARLRDDRPRDRRRAPPPRPRRHAQRTPHAWSSPTCRSAPTSPGPTRRSRRPSG